jgi:hypothetical protein
VQARSTGTMTMTTAPAADQYHLRRYRRSAVGGPPRFANQAAGNQRLLGHLEGMPVQPGSRCRCPGVPVPRRWPGRRASGALSYLSPYRRSPIPFGGIRGQDQSRGITPFRPPLGRCYHLLAVSCAHPRNTAPDGLRLEDRERDTSASADMTKRPSKIKNEDAIACLATRSNQVWMPTTR